jgi:eukaryotic-like serine/threonine-protein kinase
MYSIINEQPELLAKYRSDTPEDLQRIISRSLEKEPEDRYQSAADMVSEIRRLQKKTTHVTRRITTEISSTETGTQTPAAPHPTGVHEKQMTLKQNLWISLGTIGVLAVVVGVILFTSKQTESLNPLMSYQALQVPFSQIGSPSLSRDGNWVVFPAIDPRGTWDLYFMNSSGGEARRITSDSAGGMFCVDISPDGSRVVYDRSDPSGMKTQVSVVSSIGGSSTRIVDVGTFPRWRPDGQRVGYARGRNSHLEFWIVRPDGSDNHREFVDTVGSPALAGSFAWSPDGNALAYARTYSDRHQELVTYDLISRTFRELTTSKKNIGDIEWTQRGTIIYSSNASGNSNLWMIAASGGQSVQITKGSGPDLSPRVSGDGKRLLYFQPQALGHIWSAKTDGSGARQLTFDDTNPINLSVSYDGKIAFTGSLPDPLKPGMPLVIMDREGNNRSQLVSSDFACHDPIWNPNGKTLLYAAHAALEAHDSVRTYLVDPANPSSTRFVTNGDPMFWMDEKTFVYYWKNASWLTTLDVLKPQKVFEDSTYAIPIQNGKYILYVDLRADKEGVWVVSAPNSKNQPVMARKKVFSSNVPWTIEFGGRYIYYTKSPGELRRLSLPNGNDERLPGTYPGLSQQSTLDVTPGGKETVYTDTRLNSKLIRIDNLFK